MPAQISPDGCRRGTLFRDLKALGQAGIPFYFKPGVGCRIKRHYYLPPVNLTVPEPVCRACADLVTHVTANPGPVAESDVDATCFTTLQRCIDERRVWRMSRLIFSPAATRLNGLPGDHVAW
ncbi:MAG: hypothetical protein QF785_09570 [Phycisphaeraceae bacterium]|nr:hypothetical protein [Phycisphaeraceae bacterium]